MEEAAVVKQPVKKTATAAKAEKLTAQILDMKGKEKGLEPLNEQLFGLKNNPALIAQYVRVYLTNQRQGTVSMKTRSEVVGSTRKIYRQKGTGGARHGSRNAPIFVGGGVTFAIKPREFSASMNKKQRKLALFVSLSMKAKDKSVKVLDVTGEEIKPKTKVISDFLETAKLYDKKVLFVLPQMTKDGFVLSARNIPNVAMIQASTLNPYEIMNAEALVFVGDSLKKLEDHYFSKNEN